MKFIFEGTEITDATMSECGRFEVKPSAHYGIAYEIALLKELIRTTDAYKTASEDDSIDDLCYPIDYANAPFFILKKLGCDVEKMSEHCTLNHLDDQNIVSYLEDTIQDLLHENASDLIGELSDKYGYKPMSLDEFQMEYKFNEEDAKNIDDLLKLF
tara:strand:+ start:888 stop:1358 length:471 start_codon:yes stop_codon:yes gene_type:complete